MPASNDLYVQKEDNPRIGTQDISIIFNKKLHHHKKRKKIRFFTFKKKELTPEPYVGFKIDGNRLSHLCSMPSLKVQPITTKLKIRSSDTKICKVNQSCCSKYAKNIVPKQRDKHYLFGRSPVQASYRVYRCQISTTEESCCCACNSDAMFEVMKSLYDCYKRKDCNNCDCILCGHLPREERLKGEMRKEIKTSAIGIGTAAAESVKMMKKEKAETLEKQFIGKSLAEKEAMLKELAASGTAFPEFKSSSDRALAQKVKMDMGFPPEPKTAAEKEKFKKAEAAGIIVPLEGKSQGQKKKILQKQAEMGVVLPEGRTASEKKLIDDIKSVVKDKSSEKIRAEAIRKAKEKEEAQKKLSLKAEPQLKKKIEPKVLPVEEVTTPEKAKIAKEQAALKKPSLKEAAVVTKAEKRKEVKPAAPLPESKILAPTAKVKAEISPPAEKVKVKEAVIPIEEKPSDQKEKMLRNLVKQQLPLPEAKTASGKKLISKIRTDVGLPPEPKTSDKKEKYAKAQAAGIIVPLEGKTSAEKEKILDKEYEAGIPLPEGRTPSEKELIKKVKASKKKAKALTEKAQKLDKKTSKDMKEGKGPSDECICDILAPVTEKVPSKVLDKKLPPPSKKLSEKLRKAKAEGLMTPLEGKSPEQKEKILKGLAKHGLPLPEPKTASEKKIAHKVRTDLGLPPEPKTSALKEKYAKAQAAGLITPLEGKSPAQKEKILKALSEAGLPLPEGRIPSEKELIGKIKGERPPKKPSLEGKTPEQKEKILKDLLQKGKSLPEFKTASEKKLLDKVKADLGFPPEPKSLAAKEKYEKALAAGIIQPLEGRTDEEKEEILLKEFNAGIPLPMARTESENEIITKIIKGKPKEKEPPKKAKKFEKKKVVPEKEPTVVPSKILKKGKIPEKLSKISLEGKTPVQKEKILKDALKKGKPMPPITTASDKKMVAKVRADLGLPPEPKPSGIVSPLEVKGKPSPLEKVIVKKKKVKHPPVSPSVSEKLRKAKAAGLASPSLEGRTPDELEELLKKLIKEQMPLPEPITVEEKKVSRRVRQELGLPPEPRTFALKRKYEKAHKEGTIVPLEGKTLAEKEEILAKEYDEGIPLPEGRTPSEKALIKKIKSAKKLDKKTSKVIKEGKGPSDECICSLLVSESEKGKVPSKVSEKVLSPAARKLSEKIRKAKEAGLMTPLEGKTPEQKEKILRGLVKHGIPLPDGKTPSDKKIINKVRTDMGLPPEPKTSALKNKYAKAQAAGIITPLEGKSPAQKEKILKALSEAGLPLPEARMPSEKALIAKVKSEKQAAKKEKELRALAQKGKPLPEGKTPSEQKIIDKIKADIGPPLETKPSALKDKYKKLDEKTSKNMKEAKGPSDECICGLLTPESEKIPSKPSSVAGKLAAKGVEKGPPPPPSKPTEKKRKVKSAELLTPLEGKTPEQKEKLLKDMVKQGKPLPDVKTPSDKKLVDKVRTDMGLPPEPKTAALKEKYAKAQAAGIITPLEGKSPAEKEKILKALSAAGLELPEGRKPSEKALIDKIKKGEALTKEKSEKIKLTPSEKKVAEKQAAEKKAADKQAAEKKAADKQAAEKKAAEKQAAEKKDKLKKEEQEKSKKLDKRTSKIMKEAKGPTDESEKIPSKPPSVTEKIPTKALEKKLSSAAKLAEKKRKSEADLAAKLEGKSRDEKEKILKDALKQGKTLPEGKTASDKKLIAKIKADVKSRERLAKAEKLSKAKLKKPTPPARPSIVRSLTGRTPSQMEKISKGLADARLERKAASERSLKKALAAKHKTRKTGEGAMAMKAAKDMAVAAGAEHKGGMAAKYEEITKTTTCDQGCGCDTRKIRFKHSYVKIMVTSPDISSLCPCPNDCIPRTKEGVFVDNDGIKVTIGRAVGAPSYRKERKIKTCYYNQSAPEINEKYNYMRSSMSSIYLPGNKISEIYVRSKHIECLHKRNVFHANSEESLAFSYESDDNIWDYILSNIKNKSNISNKSSASKYLITCSEHYGTPLTISWSSVNETDNEANVKSSHVLLVVKTNSSLSFSSKISSSIDTISVTSLNKSNITSSTSSGGYPNYSESRKKAFNLKESKSKTKNLPSKMKIDNVTRRTRSEESDLDLAVLNNNNNTMRKQTATKRDVYDVVILRIETNIVHNKDIQINDKQEGDNPDPIAVIKNVNSEFEIGKIIENVIAKERYISKSSILVLVPFSGENFRNINSESASSTICVRLSENLFRSNAMPLEKLNDKLWPYQGLKIEVKGKLFDIYGQVSNPDLKCPEPNEDLLETYDCQMRSGNGVEIYESKIELENFSMDTSQDRPCCCSPPNLENDNYSNDINHIVVPTQNMGTSMRKVFFDDPVSESSDEEDTQFNQRSLNIGVVNVDNTKDKPCCCCCLVKKKSSVDLNTDVNSGNSIASEIITPIITSERIEQGIGEYVFYQNESELNAIHKKYVPESRATRFDPQQCVVYQAKRSKNRNSCGYDEDCPCATQTPSCAPPFENASAKKSKKKNVCDVECPCGAQTAACNPPPYVPPPAPPCTLLTEPRISPPPALRQPSPPAPQHAQPTAIPCAPPSAPHPSTQECTCTPKLPSNKMNSVAAGGSEPIFTKNPDPHSHLQTAGINEGASCTPCAPYPRPTVTGTKRGTPGTGTKPSPTGTGIKPSPPGAGTKPIKGNPPGIRIKQTAAKAKNAATQSDPMPNPSSPPITTRVSFGCQYDSICENSSCTCANVTKSKKKKLKCECRPESSWDHDNYTDYNYNEENARKMNMQGEPQTSGFNVKFKKKQPVEVDMSFEDALAWFEQYEPEAECDKSCKKKKKKNVVECECPYIPPGPIPCDPQPVDEVNEGVKIQFGGKGSVGRGREGRDKLGGCFRDYPDEGFRDHPVGCCCDTPGACCHYKLNR